MKSISKENNTKNVILAVVTVIFSSFFLVFSLALPKAERGVGAGFWPTTVLFIMLFLGIFLLVKELVYNKSLVRKQEKREVKEQQSKESPLHPFRHWLVAGIMVLAFMAVPYFGFIFTIPVFILAMAKVLGRKKWLEVIVMALLLDIFFVGLCSGLLALELPRGIGLFREISYLIF